MHDLILDDVELIDLSVLTRPADPSDREVWAHEDGARRLSRNAIVLPGYSRMRRFRNRMAYTLGSKRIRACDLPDASFLRNEFLRLSTHAGTHVDAPLHYGETCEGRPSRSISEVPLEQTFRPGVVIDVREAGPHVSADFIRGRTEVDRVREGTAVLFRTGCDRLAGSSEYFTKCPSFSTEAIEFLLDCGAVLFGVDSWSLDGPARDMIENYYATRDGRHLWPVHMLGRRREFLQVENLCNLDRLPTTPFHLIVLPVKLADAGGAWARAAAMVPRPSGPNP